MSADTKPTMQQALIQRWSYEIWDNGDLVLVGTVYGHPRLPNGAFVHTSTVMKLDLKKSYAVTRNTIYQLGTKLKADSE